MRLAWLRRIVMSPFDPSERRAGPAMFITRRIGRIGRGGLDERDELDVNPRGEDDECVFCQVVRVFATYDHSAYSGQGKLLCVAAMTMDGGRT